jgi:hypothetical protein
LAGGKPDACNQEPFLDFALHRVTLLRFVQHRTYPIDDKHRVPAGIGAASGGWNLALVLSFY